MPYIGGVYTKMPKLVDSQGPTWTGLIATWVVAILLVGTIGGVTLDYSLQNMFDKDMPLAADFVGGVFLSQFTVPAALGCWIAIQCDVEPPFFGPKIGEGSATH